jgi:hypothetical protein
MQGNNKNNQHSLSIDSNNEQNENEVWFVYLDYS